MGNEKKLKKLHAALREFERGRGKTIEYILIEIIYRFYNEDPRITLDAIHLYLNWVADFDKDAAEWFDKEYKPAEIISMKGENETETDD